MSKYLLPMLMMTGLSLSSCGTAVDLLVVRGNRAYRDGNFNEAAALYLKAGAGRQALASYDLANIFASLDENESARQMFDVAIESGDPALAARAWYNLGAAAWNRAEFPESAAAFRKSLEVYVEAGVSGQNAAPPGPAEARFRRESARAYELALAAASRKRDAGAVERGTYGLGRVSGDVEALALSRMEQRTLYAPGAAEDGGGVDH
jgi:tetratricopeptide (TPR) repeat protein